MALHDHQSLFDHGWPRPRHIQKHLEVLESPARPAQLLVPLRLALLHFKPRRVERGSARCSNVLFLELVSVLPFLVLSCSSMLELAWSWSSGHIADRRQSRSWFFSNMALTSRRGWLACAALLIPALLSVVAQLECDQELTVSSTADATALSEAMVNCADGTVSVEWTGVVVVEKEIQVVGGTSLAILGMDGAAADGNSTTPLFFVNGSTLIIEDMALMNGNRSDFTGGGAVLAIAGASVSVRGTTAFMGNECSTEPRNDAGGGAVQVEEGSTFTWAGNTTFVDNAALNYDGGAINCWQSCNCAGTGTTLFKSNFGAGDAGAVRISNSTFSCDGDTSFIDNVASREGGAFFATDGSAVTFVGTTIAINNSAGSGGAFSLEGDTLETTMSFLGSTTIAVNTALGDGGGIALAEGSNVTWDGELTMEGNTAGDDGGGLSMAGDSGFSGSGDAVFRRNTATSKGGAVYANANIEGLAFDGAVFESNSAATGGAIASFSTESSGVSSYNGCIFRDNRASSSGGAIEVSDGEEVITNSSFIYNVAETNSGGALRLSGKVTIDTLLFEGNKAATEGAAVSNIGVLSATSISFVYNTFFCSAGTFADYAKDGDGISETRYDTVCAGCPTAEGAETCENCTIDDPGRVPAGCAQPPEGAVDVAGATLETLEIEPGWYRATNTSIKIFLCYRENACLGGQTGGEDFCASGYTGPYCAICRTHFAPSLAFTCDMCAGWRKWGPRIALGVVGVVALVAVTMGVTHLVSLKATPRELGVARRWARSPFSKLKLSSFKILVVVWQILTQFAGVANITYPGVYDRFLRTFDLINLDLGFVLSAGCVLTDFDFHDRLLATTLGPLVALALLAATYSFARNKAKQKNREGIPTVDEVAFSSKIQASLRGVRSNSVVAAEGPLKRGDGAFERAPASGQDFSRRAHNAPAAMPTEAEDADNHALRRVKSKHFSAVLLLTFFVYSTVSSSLFQMFACDPLDDGRIYLRADYRIECTSPKHRILQGWSAVMMLIYPVGIPLWYIYLLWPHRQELNKKRPQDQEELETRQTESSWQGAKQVSDLWEPYKPGRWYYETVDCFRRIMLTGVVVFIYPGDAAQIAATIMIAFAFFVVSESTSPYDSAFDTWLSRSGHVVVVCSLFVALLDKVDVSSEREASQTAFGGVLVTLHICLILVVLGESIYSYSDATGGAKSCGCCACFGIRRRKPRRCPVASFPGVERNEGDATRRSSGEGRSPGEGRDLL